MKYVFVGNRKFVLETMMQLGLDIVGTLVVKGTHLEREIHTITQHHSVIASKAELLDALDALDFDILVSNGCPFILPVGEMKPRRYVNIHPSLLPDLKGIDPVIGAVLFGRDSGATCHLMNDRIDAGEIISQVRIPYTGDLDVSLLYQLSFLAEQEAFRLAHARGFLPEKAQTEGADDLYYSRTEADKQIDFGDDIAVTVRRIKAFNNRSQGAYFTHGGAVYKVYDVDLIDNAFVTAYAAAFKTNEVMFVYEDSIVLRHRDGVVKLTKIAGDLSGIKVRTVLGEK